MRLEYDELSPFTKERQVMREYVSESNDNMLLDFSTGYVTMELLFNRNNWAEMMPESEMEPYAESLVNDLEPTMKKYASWIDGQLWTLIEMGYEENLSLKPIEVQDQLKWEVTEDGEVELFDKFADAYDRFNKTCNLLASNEEE